MPCFWPGVRRPPDRGPSGPYGCRVIPTDRGHVRAPLLAGETGVGDAAHDLTLEQREDDQERQSGDHERRHDQQVDDEQADPAGGPPRAAVAPGGGPRCVAGGDGG
ncbi:hypothetical protein ACFPN0_02280 [Kitasatospora cinereorecta]